jgi:beta-1,4-mannosyltransferase
MNQPAARVLMMPDYRLDNPYQFLLAQALESQSMQVIFPQGYRRIFPCFRAVQDNSVTVLHLHWLTPYIKGNNWWHRLIYSLKFLLDLCLVRLAGVKIIWTIHNQLAHDCQFPQLELWLRKSLTKIVHKIIIHHQSTLARLEPTLKLQSKPTFIVAHGHYRDFYPAASSQLAARKKLNFPLTGYLYLNLGMIRPYKGIENLLKVWQKCQVHLNEYTLLIAGKPLDLAYEAVIKTQVTQVKRAILTPHFIPADQMHLYFSAADIVVLPFSQILTSGSLILAMSYHKPIIAPRQKEIVETLQSADSLLYDPGDRDGLAKALIASTQIDLSQLSTKVKQECDRLNWQTIAQQTAALYRT